MAFDFASAKLKMRRAVHATLGVSAVYEDASLGAPQPVKIRWHNKIGHTGDLENSGYAQVIEGIERVVFEAAQARALGVRYGGTVTITWPETAEVFTLTLGAQWPADGPFEEIWTVSQE